MALVTALSSAPALATDPATPISAKPLPPTVTIDTVQVTGKRRDDTAARVVVDREELLGFGDTRLADALKRVPGVVVSAGAPGGGATISLRGLADGYTQILVDGQPAPAGFDLGAVSPQRVERVEILRTTTAELRSEAIAGTINIVLARAARSDAQELTLGLGSHHGQWNPTVAWSRSRRGEYGGHRLSLTAGRRAFHVEETGSETGRDAADALRLQRSTALVVDGQRDSVALASGLQHTLANGVVLAFNTTLDASSYDKRGDIRWDTQLGEGLQHVRYRQATAIDVVQLRTDGSWKQSFEHAGTLDAKLSLGGNREQFRFREHGYDRRDALNLDDRTDARLRVTNLATSGKYALPAPGAHTIELGWDASVDGRHERRRQTLAAVDGQPRSISDQSFESQVRRLAAYMQDDWRVAPDWSLYLGGRWERIDTASEASSVPAVRAAWSIFSPVLQSLWKPPGAADDRLRVGLARTYRAPDPRDLSARPYTSTNNRALNADRRGNPALRPELANGLDLAYERSWASDALLSVGLYLKDIEHLIRDETRQHDGRWVSTPVNAGRARLHGIELEWRSPLRAWWAGAPDLQLRFSAARHWAAVEGVPGSHDRIAGQPSAVATLGADWRGAGSLSAGVSLGYRSDDLVRINALETRRTSAQCELDVYVLRRISPRSSLRMSVGDVLARDATSGASYRFDDGHTTTERRRIAHPTLRMAWEVRL